MEIEDVPVSPS